MVDVSRCYLHTLGESESLKLEDLRGRIPSLLAQARAECAEGLDQLTIWQINIEERSDAADIVLLKFLRAEELDVDLAAQRIVRTLVFRADCRIDALRDAELPSQFTGHDYISGLDVEGRPVMISTFGTMDIDKVFNDTEMFVRYRAKLMEQAIAQLSFKRGAAEDLTQIHDYSGVIGSMYKASVKNGVSAVSQVFGEHYPEFKGKTMFLNFPGVFASPFKAFVSLLPARTRSKIAVLGKEDHLALFQQISPGIVPTSLGGLYRTPPGPAADVPGHVVHVRARAVEEATVLEVSGPASIHWELCVCYAEVAYEVVFRKADGEELAAAASEVGSVLTAEDGIVTGSFEAPGTGAMVCRFRNERAWFKARVCACRAAEIKEVD